MVGIRFKANNWTCNVLGDSCLIAKIGGEYIFGTSQDVEKFDNNPDYLDSASNKKGRGTCKMLSEVMSSSNPLVLLVSDPFSDYVLEHKKIGDIDALVNELLTINTHENFEAIVAKYFGDNNKIIETFRLHSDKDLSEKEYEEIISKAINKEDEK